jgi:hypothetical protein
MSRGDRDKCPVGIGTNVPKIHRYDSSILSRGYLLPKRPNSVIGLSYIRMAHRDYQYQCCSYLTVMPGKQTTFPGIKLRIEIKDNSGIYIL